MDQKKFTIATLGCRTNQYESQAYASQLRSLGYGEAQEGEAADLAIVNTCTVTESADRHSRHQISRLQRSNPGALLIVTGCLAERLPKEIEGMQGVTHVVPNRDKENLLHSIFPDIELPEFRIDQFSSHTRAFVKIQDGCNSFCTYCIIPYVRGRSRSREIEDIVTEIHGLVASGYKEVVLTGINIGDFQTAKQERLVDLVQAVDQIEGIERIRLSSIDPDEVDEPLIEAVVNGKKTCHSLHIVLQAGSNLTLKRMNRKYTKQIFLDTVDRLKRASAEFTFTTDIIVGFPGETEREFQETIDVMREVQFAKVHMFPYSARARTRASLFPNSVPPSVIEDRKQRVLRESEKISFELRQKYVGKEVEVLMEEGQWGHTANFLPVMCPGEKNSIVRVICMENSPTGLVASV